MRRLPFLLAALLCMAATAVTAAPPSDAQVDRLLEVMRARDTVTAVLPQVQASQQQMLAQMTAGQTLTPEQRASLDRITRQSGTSIARALSWEKLEPLYRDIYRRTFSAEDMDAMIGFYASPAGQKLLDKMPQLMQNTMSAMQTLLVPMLQDLQKSIEAEVKGMAADKPAESATAP